MTLDATPSVEKLKILLVSTSNLWVLSARSVLAALPDVELLETARGSLTAYQAACSKKPHILIVDDSLPIEEGLSIIVQIQKKEVSVYSIVIVSTTQNKYVALASGADAVLSRSGASRQLEAAVQAGRIHVERKT